MRTLRSLALAVLALVALGSSAGANPIAYPTPLPLATTLYLNGPPSILPPNPNPNPYDYHPGDQFSATKFDSNWWAPWRFLQETMLPALNGCSYVPGSVPAYFTVQLPVTIAESGCNPGVGTTLNFGWSATTPIANPILSAGTIQAAGIISTLGVNVGGALTGATTGAFSGSLTADSLHANTIVSGNGGSFTGAVYGSQFFSTIGNGSPALAGNFGSLLATTTQSIWEPPSAAQPIQFSNAGNTAVNFSVTDAGVGGFRSSLTAASFAAGSTYIGPSSASINGTLSASALSTGGALSAGSASISGAVSGTSFSTLGGSTYIGPTYSAIAGPLSSATYAGGASAYVPPVYDPTGVPLAGTTHIVTGAVYANILNGQATTSIQIPLTGAARFSNIPFVAMTLGTNSSVGAGWAICHSYGTSLTSIYVNVVTANGQPNTTGSTVQMTVSYIAVGS